MAVDELQEMARRVIDGNRYLVLGTVEDDGQPRLSPVTPSTAEHGPSRRTS